MRKKLWFVVILIMIFSVVLSACNSTNDLEQPNNTDDTTNESKEQESDNSVPKHQYVGEYQKEPVYQKLIEFESCKDPDVMCQLLTQLYDEEFTYIKLEQKNLDNYEGYKEPYDNFICGVFGLYNVSAPLAKGLIKSDTYVFFRSYSEEPSFVMDSEGTYIIYSYKILQLDNGSTGHSVNSWVASDLFMCLHGYIEADTEKKDFMRDSVRYMDYYLEFENLIIDSLGDNTGSITKTEGLVSNN